MSAKNAENAERYEERKVFSTRGEQDIVLILCALGVLCAYNFY
jgi:hypothetical protein